MKLGEHICITLFITGMILFVAGFGFGGWIVRRNKEILSESAFLNIEGIPLALGILVFGAVLMCCSFAIGMARYGDSL